jgi:hypothetical protein
MKTAGFLWGDLRTWNYIKNKSMLVYKDLYGDIDWFMAVWESNTDTEQNIRNFFKENNLNLKFFAFLKRSEISEPFQKYRDKGFVSTYYSTLSRAYFAYYLCKYKKLYEINHEVEYDRTIVTRPDLLLFYNQQSINFEIDRLNFDKDLHFYLSLRGSPHYNPYFHGHGVTDTFFIFGKFSIDLWGLHYLDFNNYYQNIKNMSVWRGEAHTDVLDFIESHRLGLIDPKMAPFSRLNLNPVIHQEVVRPTMDITRLIENCNKWDGEYWIPGKDDAWNQADVDQKIKILEEFKIDKRDYHI